MTSVFHRPSIKDGWDLKQAIPLSFSLIKAIFNKAFSASG